MPLAVQKECSYRRDGEHTEPEQSEHLGWNFLRVSYESITGNECECRHCGLRRGIKAEAEALEPNVDHLNNLYSKACWFCMYDILLRYYNIL